MLRGEMRLVGPRPELEYFVPEFATEYDEILTVPPGITGEAQLRFLDEKSLLLGPDPAGAYRETRPAGEDQDRPRLRPLALAARRPVRSSRGRSRCR